MARSGNRAMADGPLVRVLVGDASRMASQLIAGQLRSSRSPRFETILPPSFTSKIMADEIVRTQPDVAVVRSILQDSSFAGYSLLRTIQSLNLPTRPILLLEDCEHDLVIDAFRSGARGVFSRAESSEQISTRVELVLYTLSQNHRREPVMDPCILQQSKQPLAIPSPVRRIRI